MEVQISSISYLGFQIIILVLHFKLFKTYYINPSLKNTLGLYVFESLKQETKKLLKKY